MKIMKLGQRISMAAAAAFVICLLPALANAQNTSRSDRNGRPVGGYGANPGDYDRLEGRLTTRTSRVRAGDSITLQYTVTNNSRATQRFRFPSSRIFDMEAVRVDGSDRGSWDNRDSRGGRGNFDGDDNRRDNRGGNSPWNNDNRSRDRSVAWRYSSDRLSSQVLSDFSLRPGQSRSFSGRWQTDRSLPAGTYEIISFLTPQRDSRIASTTTRVSIEENRGGRDDNWDNRPGRDNGNNGRDNKGTLEVRDLLRSDRYVGQRVTVRGIYRSNGDGNNSWLLDGGNNQVLKVIGNSPKNGGVNDRVSVTGTLRRSRTGSYTLENN